MTTALDRDEKRTLLLRSWAFDDALPYWAEFGVDRVDGGFVEHLGLDGRDGMAPFKRVRAQARQIYVFSHAALLGWQEGADIALHGWRFLLQHGRREDGAWVRRMGRAGGTIDATCDAYDMAFVLFAHAWMFRLTHDRSILESAWSTITALDATLLHANGLGWHADETRRGPREQNPHMHMMEAAIELADASREDRFFDFAARIHTLFVRHLFEEEHDIVREFSNSDWSTPDEIQGNIVEPGHLLEWSWILHHARRLIGLDSGLISNRLYQRGITSGQQQAHGLIIDQVDPDGNSLSHRCRIWPQTEALKAHLASYEAGNDMALPQAQQCVDAVLEHYLNVNPRGCWIDQLDADLKPDITKIPSTTFYHVLLAFSEWFRLFGPSGRMQNV